MIELPNSSRTMCYLWSSAGKPETGARQFSIWWGTEKLWVVLCICESEWWLFRWILITTWSHYLILKGFSLWQTGRNARLPPDSILLIFLDGHRQCFLYSVPKFLLLHLILMPPIVIGVVLLFLLLLLLLYKLTVNVTELFTYLSVFMVSWTRMTLF